MQREQANGEGGFWLDHRDRRNRSHSWRYPSPRERRREQVMRDWFGPDVAAGEIRSHQRPAVALGNSLDSLMRELGRGREVLLEELRDHWSELVGVEVARRTQPLRLFQDCLDVEVSHSTWLYELQTRLGAGLTERVAEFSKGRVCRLRFVPAGRRRSFGRVN